MDNTDFQSDLFEEAARPDPKKRPQRQHPVARGYRLSLSISYEQIVFFAIAFIMLMVLIFSLGVEKGKRLLMPPESPVLEFVKPEIMPKPVITATAEKIMEESSQALETKKALAVLPEPKTEKIEKSVLVDTPKPPSKPYTIQVATYWTKANAKRELEKLRRNKFDSFIISTNGKYEICVGEYINKAGAKADMEKLNKRYKDRFLRRR